MGFESLNFSKLKFCSAKATNTRLMGVVGVVAEWLDESDRKITQIYHLDFESYGIDGFYHMIEPTTESIETIVLGVTGGLGGNFVDINFEEFKFLIKSSYIIDETCIDSLVDFEYFEDVFEQLYANLTLAEECELYKKLMPEIVSQEQTINYFIMRCVGCDYPAAMALWYNGEIDERFELSDRPQTLIKNSIKLLEEGPEATSYTVESVIDDESKYKLVLTEVVVDRETLTILKAKVLDSLQLSSIEAAFNLNKPEYMMVMNVKDVFFERKFMRSNPEMMRQVYHSGVLYIEFNSDNRHVEENPYFLNGDVYAMYFFTVSKQLIICTLKKANLEAINKMLIKSHAYNESLQFICELKTDDPILLSYINSGSETIFDFLSHT